MILQVCHQADVNHNTYHVDLLCGSVSDEEGLSSPLEGHVLALGNVRKLNLDLGQGQNVLDYEKVF